MKTVFIEAKFRVIGRAKGMELVKPQKIVVEHSLTKFPTGVGDDAYRTQVFFAQVEASVRLAAQDLFVKQLKADSALKRQIGGVAWAVEPAGHAMEFPIYLNRESVGTLDKLIDTRRSWRILDQIVQRNLNQVGIINRELEAERAYEERGTEDSTSDALAVA